MDFIKTRPQAEMALRHFVSSLDMNTSLLGRARCCHMVRILSERLPTLPVPAVEPQQPRKTEQHTLLSEKDAEELVDRFFQASGRDASLDIGIALGGTADPLEQVNTRLQEAMRTLDQSLHGGRPRPRVQPRPLVREAPLAVHPASRLPVLTEQTSAPATTPGTHLHQLYTQVVSMANQAIAATTQQFIDGAPRARFTVPEFTYQRVDAAGMLQSFPVQVDAIDLAASGLDLADQLRSWCDYLLQDIQHIILEERAAAGGDANAYMVNKCLSTGARMGLEPRTARAPKNLVTSMIASLCQELPTLGAQLDRLIRLGLTRQLLLNLSFPTGEFPPPPFALDQMRSIMDSFLYKKDAELGLTVPHTSEECMAVANEHWPSLAPQAVRQVLAFWRSMDKLHGLESYVTQPGVDRVKTMRQWDASYVPIVAGSEADILTRILQEVRRGLPPMDRVYVLGEHARLGVQNAQNVGSVSTAMNASRFLRAGSTLGVDGFPS